MIDLSLLLGRVLLVALYVDSGLRKFGNLGALGETLAGKGFPLASAAAPVAAGLEVLAALAIVIGFKTRIAALALIGFTILATVVFHNYWDFAEGQRAMQRIQFFKNVGLIGGFLLLVASGAGRFSVDRREIGR